MGRLIVIEGLDGSGKTTLARKLQQSIADTGATVATWKFPRYGHVHGDLIHEVLHGQHGDLSESIYGMAMLYALDRYAAAAGIRDDLDTHDVVLVDRYSASNAAFQAARLHQDADGTAVEWVTQLEFTRFGIPVPDVQLLLKVSSATATSRMTQRTFSEEHRPRDIFEADDDLQARCAKVYDQLVDREWQSPWHVVNGLAHTDIPGLASDLLN